MANKLKRPDDYVDYFLSTLSSHGTLASAFMSMKKQSAGNVILPLRNKDPGLLLEVGFRSAKYIVEASLAVDSIIKWNLDENIKKLWEEIQLELNKVRQLL